MGEPSPFVAEWLPRVASVLVATSERAPSWRALDLAMGKGRHAASLAAAGFRVFGIDLSLEALREARLNAQQRGASLRALCADLTGYPLPAAWFDLVLVSRYLDRQRMTDIGSAVAPGGVLVYETFTRHQLTLGRGPTSPSHLLDPGELFACFSSWDVLFYEEVAEPDAVARVVARRRDTSRS